MKGPVLISVGPSELQLTPSKDILRQFPSTSSQDVGSGVSVGGAAVVIGGTGVAVGSGILVARVGVAVDCTDISAQAVVQPDSRRNNRLPTNNTIENRVFLLSPGY